MKKLLLCGLAVLAFVLTSCGGDEPSAPDSPQNPGTENPDDRDLNVTVNPDGTTSTGVPFSWAPDSKTKFYLNHIQYQIVDTHIEVSGVDEEELKYSLNGHIKFCKSVTIDNRTYMLRAIKEEAFRDSKNLVSIEIPDWVTTIGGFTFYGCQNLTSVNLPEGLTEIVYHTFYKCSKLSSIDLPHSVRKIGQDAFYGCKSLVSIKFPENLTEIESEAFADCSSLTAIQIPAQTNIIGCNAFHNSGVTSVIIDDAATKLNFNDSNTGLRGTFGGNVTDLYLGRSIDFYDLGQWTWGSLKNVTVGGYVTSFNPIILDNCKLENLILKDGVKSIEGSPWTGNHYVDWSCMNLYLPKTITKIGKEVFSQAALNTLYVHWTDESVINSFSLYRPLYLISLYVPKGYKKVYADCEWIRAESIYEMDE